MGDEEYVVRATPHRQTVAVGAKVTYRLVPLKGGIIGPRQFYIPQWFVWADSAANEPSADAYSDQSPTMKWSWEFTLSRPGKFMVNCALKDPGGATAYYEYPQWVEPVEAILSRELVQVRSQSLPSFEETWKIAIRKAMCLRAIEKKLPIADPKKKADHDRLIARLNGLALKAFEFKKQFSPSYELPSAQAVSVLHHADATQTPSRLSVGVGWEVKDYKPTGEDGPFIRVALADWTNPMDKVGSLFIEIWHPFDKERRKDLPYMEAEKRKAYEAVIAVWKDRNRYYPGTVKYEFTLGPNQPSLTGSFRSEGKTFWDKLSDWLDWVATGALIVLAVVTLVAPVPGSQVLSALIWSAIFTGVAASTGAAVINIGQRHAEGFGNWHDDALDGLTVVANLFLVTGAWAKGATLISRGAAGQLSKLTLIGDIGANAAQGVLIAPDFVSQYDQVVADKSMSPDERLQKLLQIFASAAGSYGLTYVNFKGSAADLQRLNTGPKHLPATNRTKAPAERVQDLRDPNKQIDLSEPHPLEGHTDDGAHKTTVNEDQQRTHPEGESKPTPVVFDPPPPAAARGTRARDDLALASKAKEKGRYILVRDSNADAVRWIGLKDANVEYRAKPENMKAKTLKEGPNAGLAAFPPDDPRTLATLAGIEPQTNAAALAANPTERDRRWWDYMEKNINKYGYKVEGHDKSYLVYLDLGGGKKAYYHGDMDLHGVFDKNGGKVLDSKSVRTELNQEFGTELIQHGAHDEWPERNNKLMAPNNGPQPPVTAYLPDGSMKHLKTVPEMKQFYEAHGLDWNGYP